MSQLYILLVPRTIPVDRFEDLVEAATALFIEEGYRRAQMADIADRLGVAKGTLYLYVESKAALLHVVLSHADRRQAAALPDTLPVPTPAAAATLTMVRKRVRERAHLPALADALTRRRVKDIGAEIEEIAAEIYDRLAENATAITLLDRCAADHPELARAWYGTGRDGITGALATYLEMRVARGRIPPVADFALTSRILLETLVTWAVHRHRDPVPTPFDPDAVRTTIVALVRNTLLGG